MSKVKLYGFGLSPGSLLVSATLDHLNIEHDFEETIPMVDTKKEEFLKINPHGKIPVLQDGDFIASESIAISRYLARTQPSTSFYPHDDIKKTALIDALIDFDVQTFRKACTPYAGEIFFGPKMRGTPEPTAERKVELEAKLDDAFGLIAAQLRREGTPFLAGEEPSLADFTTFFSTTAEVKFSKASIKAHKEFSEWYTRVSEIPAVSKVYEGFEEKAHAFIESLASNKK